MDFGRVPAEELGNIDFRLAAEPSFNKGILKSRPVKDPKVYIGCAKWGRTEWLGKIYPPKTKEKDFLDHYVHHYNSIELNATHYKVYGEAGIKKWTAKAAGKDFKFCPKMYQGITHRGSLKGKNFITNEFFRGIVAFEEWLGPIFIQVSETFSPKRKDELFEFLQTMPTDLQFFMEVRHPDWFKKPAIRDELFTKLKEMNIGAVITDTAGRRDCAHMHLTVPKAYYRFAANGMHSTDLVRIDQLAERFRTWFSSGLEELYFIIHPGNELISPELSVYIAEKLNEICEIETCKPGIINPGLHLTQTRLFG